MKRIIVFELAFLTIIIVGIIYGLSSEFPAWLKYYSLWYFCVLVGGIGGVIYCLRGVYISSCVRKDWNDIWQPWYYIRPFVSLVCGGVACLFLKAGLLVLESGQRESATDLGIYSLAFIAGLNVDNFVKKIEDIARATWGIEKSRITKRGGSRGNGLE